MKEVQLTEGVKVIELYRNDCYEYYIETDENANLYFSFGVENSFPKEALIALFNSGYFDYEIEKSRKIEEV